jgi:hypothetical protein
MVKYPNSFSAYVNRVYDRVNPNGVTQPRCDGCGSFHDGERWYAQCNTCKTIVPIGMLCGMFVNTRCHECENTLVESERASGRICRNCSQPYSQCCC